jgi:hypothetical protein|tara:strand:+ start:817 stop:999 length:183 start_codon:yes stop_codon:yes gene_type:complete
MKTSTHNSRDLQRRVRFTRRLRDRVKCADCKRLLDREELDPAGYCWHCRPQFAADRTLTA